MNRNERCKIEVLLKKLGETAGRMKTIAPHRHPIGGPGGQPRVSLGILISTYPDMIAAFAAKDAFQKTAASGRHSRTKIVRLKDQLEVG